MGSNLITFGYHFYLSVSLIQICHQYLAYSLQTYFIHIAHKGKIQSTCTYIV